MSLWGPTPLVLLGPSSLEHMRRGDLDRGRGGGGPGPKLVEGPTNSLHASGNKAKDLTIAYYLSSKKPDIILINNNASFWSKDGVFFKNLNFDLFPGKDE